MKQALKVFAYLCLVVICLFPLLTGLIDGFLWFISVDYQLINWTPPRVFLGVLWVVAGGAVASSTTDLLDTR